MSSTKYIGMDVHKESISIAVRNAGGKVVMECVIETKASMILQFIDRQRGDLRVTFEEGTSAALLYDVAKWYCLAAFVNQAAQSASQSGGNMKARKFVLTLALCFIGAAVCFAQNPFMGTWKLNEAKSTLAPGMPKNNSVVYETEGINMKVTIDGTDGAGNKTHNEWTGQFDGKEYPVKGDPNSDSRSYTRKGIHELDFVVKKGTTVTTSGRIVVSDDGKSRTVTSRGTDAKGKKFKSTALYDMQ